jgi:hypothetical protein
MMPIIMAFIAFESPAANDPPPRSSPSATEEHPPGFPCLAGANLPATGWPPGGGQDARSKISHPGAMAG